MDSAAGKRGNEASGFLSGEADALIHVIAAVVTVIVLVMSNSEAKE